ncbi:MAG: hypothetical protein D6778_02250 [Nitrospirae bacterium]|nr:MAG: hypothetical protein D6778_02250 [Nitrospirota bacterium]
MKRVSLSVVLLLVFLGLTFGVSVYKRFWQLSVWNQYKNVFYAKDGLPSMTTADAYFFLRLAKEYKKGNMGKADPLRYYPEGSRLPDSPGLLVLLLAWTSDLFFGGDIYRAGIYIIPFLASLFVIPLVLYFYRLGHGFVGVAGGLIGTFSSLYYVRTSIGRVDTDAMNLFFPLMVALFFLLVIQSKENRQRYIYSALAGITMLVFQWWYQRYQFSLVYPVFFFLCLLVNRFRMRDILVLTGIFILFSNPLNFFYGIRDTLSFLQSGFVQKEAVQKGSVVWPNVMETITETRKVRIAELMEDIVGEPLIGYLGLVAICVVAVKRYREVLPLYPMMAIGLLAPLAGIRFGLYLVPLLATGIGYAIYFVVRFVFKYLNLKEKLLDPTVGALIVVFFFVTASHLTAYNHVPPPKLPVPMVNAILELKEKVPHASPVFTWWDWGYALADIGGFAVYHDGGSQGGVRTYFVAKAFVEDDQKKMYSILSAIDNLKFKGIEEKIQNSSSPNKTVEEILTYKGSPTNPNIMVLYTEDMIDKFGAISFLGNWDFETKKTKTTGLQRLSCSKIEAEKIYCRGLTIDLKEGKINNTFPLKRAIFSINGKSLKERVYQHPSRTFLIVLVRDRQIKGIFLLDEEVLRSNLVQMFLLGNYDRKLFEEVHNDFPVLRAFRVKLSAQ